MNQPNVPAANRATICNLWSRLRKHLPGRSAPPVSPRLVFERFQKVLASNNQALEIIADLGEKLGGDYLFDMRYVESSVEQLIAAVHGSVVAVNELCAGRHAGLQQVHERLSEDLRLTLAGREDREGPLIFTLDEIRPPQLGLGRRQGCASG